MKIQTKTSKKTPLRLTHCAALLAFVAGLFSAGLAPVFAQAEAVEAPSKKADKSTEKSNEKASADTNAVGPVKIWISSQQDKEYYDQMVKTYRETVDVNFNAVVSAYGFMELPDKLGVSLRTGEGIPDIVQLDEAFFGSFLADPPFVDLTSRMKAAKLDKRLLKARADLFSWKGKYYGIPQSLSAMVLYYRKDLFEKFDLKPEQFKTWSDVEDIGFRLAQDEGIAFMSMDATYFEILLRQRGSDFFGKDGKAFPDMDTAVATLSWLVDVTKDGIAVQPERGSVFDPLFFSSQVANDDLLCIMGADWYGLDLLPQFCPELEGKWGIMPLPVWEKGGKRTSCFAGQGLMIVKDTPLIDASWKFLEWVMSDTEANVKRYQMGNSFPAYKPVWKDPRLKEPTEYFGDVSMGKVLLDIAKEIPTVAMHPKRPQAMFMFQENYFATAIHEVRTPEEVLKDLKKTLDE